MTETDLHQIETDNLSLDDVRAQQAVAELVAEVRRRCAVQADLQAACQAALLHKREQRQRAGDPDPSALERILTVALVLAGDAEG
jgi:hypothetical protein